MNYKLTINANICFDYYPYEKTTSEEVPCIVNYNEMEYYDEYHDVELEITPKMLLECLDFVYKYDKSERDNAYVRHNLLVALEKNNWYFNKICAEFFNEENLDETTSIYDYLTSCGEFKKKEKEIIKNEVRGLGELYE